MTTNLLDFTTKILQAKQVQAAGQANSNLRDHVGEKIVVTGIHITRDIEIKAAGLTLDKVTYQLQDGTCLDGFCLAASESASETIELLGEGPYPVALEMLVVETPTKRGKDIQYVKLLGFSDPDDEMDFKLREEQSAASFKELIEPEDISENGYPDPNA
jgi:hypothetical protein